MKYMGSKARIAKYILPYIKAVLKPDMLYVEPFLGGANMMSAVNHPHRLGIEYNHYVAEMWSALLTGWQPKIDLTKEEYIHIRDNKDKYPAHVVGYTGICCSYCGKWFGGYAATITEKGRMRDYRVEAWNNTTKQLKSLAGLSVRSGSYESFESTNPCVIYCDPPYRETTGYKDSFDSDKFFDWVRAQVEKGHIVLISEYSAPDDFVELWVKPVKSSLSANGSVGGSKVSTERLFCHQSQKYLFLGVDTGK